MAGPHTQHISLDWSPEVSFYEKRYAVLRELEERGQLRAFRSPGDQLQLQLFDGRTLLMVTLTGFTLQIADPGVDDEAALDVIDLVLKQLEPRQPNKMVVFLQHLVPLDLDFDAAVALGRKNLFHFRTPAPIDLADWAMLCDLTSDDIGGQVEFGVVTREEVPRRLARAAGRTTGTERSPSEWEAEEFAAVSLFADIGWSRGAQSAAGGLPSELSKFWRGRREESSTLVDSLMTQLMAPAHKKLDGEAA